jgi:hypothetical protein
VLVRSWRNNGDCDPTPAFNRSVGVRETVASSQYQARTPAPVRSSPAL